MGLNEIALITLLVTPFIYLILNHSIKCERHLNKRERRNKL